MGLGWDELPPRNALEKIELFLARIKIKLCKEKSGPYEIHVFDFAVHVCKLCSNFYDYVVPTSEC